MSPAVEACPKRMVYGPCQGVHRAGTCELGDRRCAFLDLGVPMVLCLTGDHPSLGDRADAAAVFDLDSTRLAALATGRGMTVAVAESPSVPPVDARPARLASKAAAGATVCFVNHGSADEIERFVDASRALTPSLRF